MFNVGMTELLVFAVITLLILGPDKLPEAIRFASRWYAKAKRLIGNIQDDIDRELRVSELKDQMQKEMQRITELEEKLKLQLKNIESLDQNTFLNQSYKIINYHNFTPISYLRLGYALDYRFLVVFQSEQMTKLPQLKVAV